MASRRPRSSPYAMVEMDAAWRVVNEEAAPLGVVEVEAEEAVGMVLADDVRALDPLPPFRASVMDGYAVIASDGAGAFPVLAPVVAGDAPGRLPTMLRGHVCRITTGAPLPELADAVVMVENTELVEANDEGEEAVVRILVGAQLGENVRPIGCDIKEGEVVLRRGTRVGAAELGVLAAVGARRVPVHRRPRVALLSTGNELVNLRESVAGAQQVRDSNRPALVALVREHGGDPVDLGIVRDDADQLAAAVRRALSDCDMLISTGGVSMGETDLLKPTIEALGGTIHFGRVRMKPGKPTTFATVCGPNNDASRRLVFALPGNPASAIVTFHLFVRPALALLAGSGAGREALTRVPAVLTADTHLDPRPEYQRVVLTLRQPSSEQGTVQFVASATGGQASSRVTSMHAANALLELPGATAERKMLPAGTVVQALLIAPL